MSDHEQEELVKEEAEEGNAAAGIAPATLSREERSRKLQEFGCNYFPSGRSE